MGEVTETRKDSLVFAVNGQRFELSNVDPSTTLIEFLRYQTPFKSVKLSCGEGISLFSPSVFRCVYEFHVVLYMPRFLDLKSTKKYVEFQLEVVIVLDVDDSMKGRLHL